MKKITALSLFIISTFTLSASAQESIIGEINYGTLEKYIAAARDYYPRRQVISTQADIAKVAVTTANIAYLDIFSATYLYRPDGQAGASTGVVGGNGNLVLGNGIQYGINVNLASFLTKPFAVKRAKMEYKVAKLQAADYDITLVAEVRRKYYAYIQSLAQLKIKTQVAQDNASVAANMRRRFEKGEITLDIYNLSRRDLADANTQQIQTEVLYLTSKDELEQIIGKKLTDIK
jgi:outer membrane protein TolC